MLSRNTLVIPRTVRLVASFALVALALGGSLSLIQGATAADQTTITVNVHGCPTTFNASSASYNDLAQNCSDQLNGIPFTLTPSGGQATNGQTGADGIVSWQGAFNGEIVITQQTPGQYDIQRVFCNQKSATGNELGYAELPVGSGNTVQDDFQSGYDEYECDWYDATSIETTSIVVNKHVCAADFSGSPTDYNSLAQNCNDPLSSSVTFTEAGQTHGVQAAQRVGSVMQNGVEFDNLPADTYTVEESVPQGFGQPSVFCKITNQATGAEGQFFEPSVSGGDAIAVQLNASEQLYCDWYNLVLTSNQTENGQAVQAGNASPVAGSQPTQPSQQPPAQPTQGSSGGGQPTTGTSLTITVWTCPAGYNVFGNGADPSKDCPDVASGVSFSSLGAASGTKTTNATGADGKVAFTNLNAGVHFITEKLPKGTSFAFIEQCTSNVRDFSSDPFAPLALIGHGGEIAVAIQSGEQLACDWYNVPSKPSTTATTASAGSSVPTVALAITLLSCPGQTVNQTQCQAAASGFTFTLTPSGNGGPPVTLTTNDDGIATGSVAAGTYTLAEGSGTWCFANSSAFAADGSLAVGDQNVDVTIYNCQS